MRSGIRKISERLSRGIVFGRHLPRDLGGRKILVSPEVGLRYWFLGLAKVDPFLLSIVRTLVHPGDVVWDVGANIGLFAFAAASRVGPAGRVLAIEPDTWLIDLMRRSSKMQSRRSAPVDILAAAVSERVGVDHLHIAKRARAANFLRGAGTPESGGIREDQLVLTVNLDWLAKTYPPPTHLKIDVEGAELSVLRGGHDLLSTIRPIVICEVSATSFHDVSAVLRDCGYRFAPEERPSSDKSGGRTPIWNILAYPNERSHDQYWSLA